MDTVDATSPGRVSVVVCFDDGQEDIVDLGLVIIKRLAETAEHHHKKARTEGDLLVEYRRRERQKATAVEPRKRDPTRSQPRPRPAAEPASPEAAPEPQGPSKVHLERMAALMQKYTRADQKDQGTNRDLEGPENYKLG